MPRSTQSNPTPARSHQSLRATALAAALAVAAPVAASAQSVTWWDVFTPDKIAEGFLRSMILTARTQVDLTYTALDVDLLNARATMTNLRVWPFFDWDETGDCEISVDRIVLTSSPLDQPDRIYARVRALGVNVPALCLPAEGRAALATVGLDAIPLAHATFALDYDVPSSAATIVLRASSPNFASAEVTADFDYLFFEAPAGSDEPTPVAMLNYADVAIDNRGGFAAVAPLLPPQLLDPGSAQLLVEGALGTALLEMARGSGDATGDSTSPTLTDPQRAFIASAVEGWSSFVSQPTRLVLRTAIHEGGGVYLDPAWADNPTEAFEFLAPEVVAGPPTDEIDIPLEAVRRALAGEAEQLDIGLRFAIGRALITGDGVPRNVDAGVNLLTPIAESGDVASRRLLAEVLESRNPPVAYRWGLLAAANGEADGPALLDRLERVLPPAEVLAAQAQFEAPVQISRLADVPMSSLTDLAQLWMTGGGAVRSYTNAATIARLLGALGDPEGPALLEEIDARMAGAGAAWAEADGRSAETAMAIWLGAPE